MSSAWKYLSVFIIPTVIIRSLLSEGVFTFGAIVFAFGLVPFIELFLKPSESNMNKIEEELALEDRLYDLFLYSLVPIQYGILFLFRISGTGLDMLTKVGMMTAYGLSCEFNAQISSS